MKLEPKFTEEQITRVMDQSLIHQCACPAQVCKMIIGLRELYTYQQGCLDETDNDERVHSRISADAAQAHELMEGTLESILDIEGWNMETLEMPEHLKKKPLKSV